jgi:hypothetical protein
MPRVPLPAVVGYYRDPNLHWSSQDLLNRIPVRAEKSGTETPGQHKDVPGLKPFASIGSGQGRGLRNVEGKLFIVSGTQLYQISNSGVGIPRGAIPGLGRVGMAHNQNGGGNQLLVVNGMAGYVYHTTQDTFAKVTDDGYPGAFVADYVDSYLAQVEPQGRYWFHSDLADANAYSTLDQYEAEGLPDRIVTLKVSHREVLVFGKETIEPYVNEPSGDGTAPFVRASNTVIECGCSAKYSPRSMDNSVFWLDDKRVVRRMDGYTPVRISTVGIEAALSECTQAQIAAAWAFTWEDRGHKVYYLTVPGKFTFGYDVLTGEWHRRSSHDLPYWPIVDVAYWNDKWIALSSLDGKLYQLDWEYTRDDQGELVREWETGVLAADRLNIQLHEVELLFNVGLQEVAAVPFSEQPDGPTITGDAPDGQAGIAYGAYSYTITPGDAPIVSVKVVSGALPPGTTLSNAGALSAFTPSVYGTYSFTVKAVDANGLWDSVDDQIEIAAPEVGYDDLFRYTVEAGGAGNTNDYSAVDFDDSSWLEGQGAFGSSALGGLSGQEINTFEAGAIGKIIWLRKHFAISPAADVRLNVYHDDGVTVWWNGSELTMTAVETYHSTVVIPAEDVLGDNVVAIRVIDGVPSGSANIYAAMDLAVES